MRDFDSLNISETVRERIPNDLKHFIITKVQHNFASSLNKLRIALLFAYNIN